MKRLSLNRNQLKYIVIAAMLIDHIAWAFVPDGTLLAFVMHFVGRLTAPTMAFFIAEGYYHTRDVKRYAMRLAVFGLISWIPFSIFQVGTLPVSILPGQAAVEKWMVGAYINWLDVTVAIYPVMSVMYTLFLGLLAIWLWDQGNCPAWVKFFGTVGLCVLSLFGDWTFYSVLYPLVLFRYRDQARKRWMLFLLITVVTFTGISSLYELYKLGILMVPLLIEECYNGQSGSKAGFHKWFFYAFYPSHLLLLGWMRY